MLSIIIPTYNYVCLQLVSDLAKQCLAYRSQSTTPFDYEIIVADDASPNRQTVEANRPINNLEGCRLVERKVNVGRAYLRNWLIDEARFNYILMIDSDALVCTDNFISNYWEHRDDANVICGSLRNLQIPCPQGYELRYRYEHHAERRRQLCDPNKNPYRRFTTFNVMVNRKSIGNLHFDERCQEYGYEDTLFGLILEDMGYTVRHIDNPLIHNGLDTNDSFLEKTEASLRTLSKLQGIMQKFAGASHVYDDLESFHLHRLFRRIFKFFKPSIRRNLLGRNPKLLLFNIYKLGYYAELKQQAHESESV